LAGVIPPGYPAAGWVTAGSTRKPKKYAKPALLLWDELGSLPSDKSGAALLFQGISARYEPGSTLITLNRAFKDWPMLFNNDSTLTAALLDRLLHHAETVVIEGKSYRMKGKLDV
jgi:DNA replication protein DnaC